MCYNLAIDYAAIHWTPRLIPPGMWSSIFGKEISHSFEATFEKLNAWESMVVRTFEGAQRNDVYLKPQVLMGVAGFSTVLDTGA